MKAVFYIRNAVYDRLQNVSFSFHDQMTTGQLINRALSDLQAVRNFVNASLLSTLDIGVSLAAYLTLLCYRSPWMMVASLLPLPLWWVAITQFNSKSQPIIQNQQEVKDSLMMALTENLSGIQVVKAFGLEQKEINKYSRLNRKLFHTMFQLTQLQSRLTPILKAIATGSHVYLFVLASWLIQKGRMSIGDLMILGLVMNAILSKLQQINSIIEIYQKATVSAQRLFEILDTPSVITPCPRSAPLKIKTGEIHLNQVTFGYSPDTPVLKEMTLKIPGNKVTAVVGPTGSGKSTLSKLIARFYEPQKGSIFIDQQDLSSVNIQHLRQLVGYVFQETFLFSDTIQNNMIYGRPDLTEEMMKKAAIITQADEFIRQLPAGYQTRLGDEGVTLSGGQKQRLALARALVYDPKILILDDALAALDQQTHQVVLTNLFPVFRNRTVLIITHNKNIIEAADSILMIETGKLIQNLKPTKNNEPSEILEWVMT
jgi:ATP-binding cassette subfamily B protein